MHLVVGVDPGTNVGLALFDINANLIYKGTINGGKERIVEKIRDWGEPCVVATDVNPAPELVLRIASYFNARLFVPQRSMLEKEKNEMVYGQKVVGDHERDAVSAALKFFRSNDAKLRWVDRVVKEKGLEKHAEEIRYYVVSGVSAADAISILTAPVPGPQTPELKERPSSGKQRKENLSMGLLKENASLRAQLSVLLAEKAALEHRLAERERETFERTLKNREITTREFKIRKLKHLLKRAAPRAQASSLKALEKNKDVNLEELVDDYRSKRD